MIAIIAHFKVWINAVAPQWAKAKIEGNKVVVWNNEIKEPIAVRYDWADNPDGNLKNKSGLPSSSFTTEN